MGKKQTQAMKIPSDKYQPSPKESAAIEKYRAKRAERIPAPRMIIEEGDDGVPAIGPSHPDPTLGQILLMQALGTTDPDFLSGILGQLANAGSHGPKLDERALNFMLSVVKDIEPQDQMEAMLASQMAAVHMATMTFARRLEHVENIPQQDSAERAFNKLARTFTTQMEALKRYRTGGQQKMTVEHVTVNDGGQAIVGNVSSGGGGQKQKTGTTP